MTVTLAVGIAADRAIVDIDVEGGVLDQVERLQPGQLGVVGRDQEVDIGGLGAVRKRDGQAVVAGNLAWLAWAEENGVHPAAR